MSGACVVGAGPAGLILSLLLARRGVPVTLLEMHKDFDRDFRGDTVHPSTLEVLDQIGLADRLHALPHSKLRALKVVHQGGETVLGRVDLLRTKYPYVMVMPQARLLEMLAEEAGRFPNFRLLLGTKMQELIEEDGQVRGVRSTAGEVRALVTVGADGRFSRVRQLAGIEPIRAAPSIDVVWLRLPRRPGDPDGDAGLYVGEGTFAVAFDRGSDWQVGYVILKGSFAAVRAQGIEALRAGIGATVPWLAERAAAIGDFKDVAVLSVEASRVARWYKPGLLLIGDAAHVMSPVAGVGINYAVQDAVEAANVLAGPLLAGRVEIAHLAEVQKRRELPVRVMQRIQALIQKRIAGAALEKRFRVPLLLRVISMLPVLRALPGRMVGFGLRRVRVDEA